MYFFFFFVRRKEGVWAAVRSLQESAEKDGEWANEYGSVFGVNGPDILLRQQMAMSSPSPNPNS